MTDIVERLECMAATGIYPKEVSEAADEIKRMRAKIKQLTAEDLPEALAKALGLISVKEGVLQDEVKTLRAEIEELKK